MPALPDCLTKFDAGEFAASECKPKRYYDVIVSRPCGGVRVSDLQVLAWSRVRPIRCVLSQEGLQDRIRQQFLVCILREFDELPQGLG